MLEDCQIKRFLQLNWSEFSFMGICRKALMLSPATKTSWFLIGQFLFYFFLFICKDSFVTALNLCRHSTPCRQCCVPARDLKSWSASCYWQQKTVKYRMSFATLHKLSRAVLQWVCQCYESSWPENNDSLKVFSTSENTKVPLTSVKHHLYQVFIKLNSGGL